MDPSGSGLHGPGRVETFVYPNWDSGCKGDKQVITWLMDLAIRLPTNKQQNATMLRDEPLFRIGAVCSAGWNVHLLDNYIDRGAPRSLYGAWQNANEETVLTILKSSM